jgi:GDPmannose 4,6-dehydratase
MKRAIKPSKALIIGWGQDASYLTEFLLERKYEVYVTVRRPWEKQPYMPEGVTILQADLQDADSLRAALLTAWPDEIYILGAVTHARESFVNPTQTIDINGNGPIRVFELIKTFKPDTRVFQAASTMMYADIDEPITVSSPLSPRSPYAWGKAIAFEAAKTYREKHDLFICCGIMTNHESERRGEEYFLRKVSKAVARISKGKQKSLELFNLSGFRDFGYAKEYVSAMWQMLQSPEPGDHTIATGHLCAIRDIVDAAFARADLSMGGKVKVIDRGQRKLDAQDVVEVGEGGYRMPTDGIKLIQMMVDHDLKESHD